jgi:broad specificity phosphatase PhoE
LRACVPRWTTSFRTDAVDDIASRHSDETITIVAHGGVINALWLKTKGVTPTTNKEAAARIGHPPSCRNASVSEVIISVDGEWVQHIWNSVEHLEGLVEAREGIF